MISLVEFSRLQDPSLNVRHGIIWNSGHLTFFVYFFEGVWLWKKTHLTGIVLYTVFSLKKFCEWSMKNDEFLICWYHLGPGFPESILRAVWLFSVWLVSFILLYGFFEPPHTNPGTSTGVPRSRTWTHGIYCVQPSDSWGLYIITHKYPLYIGLI